MEKIIEVSGLVKSYGKVAAVRGIDFYAETGKLFAFLGPNGAGKSTTIDILVTLLAPDGGSVMINGHQLGKDDVVIRNEIGVVFQDSLLDNFLTVKENLYMRAGFYGITGEKLHESVKRAVETTGVSEFLDRPYGKLSGGQRRRSDIARALVHTPKILFLDEPTTGLDPQTRKNIWATIRDLQQQNGTTVFLTTHYMEEAADADYICVIDNGLIAAKGSPTELKHQYSSDLLKLQTNNHDKLVEILGTLHTEFNCIHDIFTIKLKSTVDAVPIVTVCKDILTNVEILNGTMDDAFIGITGKEIRE